MTDNFLKRQQIIIFVAIAFTITACSISPQLELNKSLSKIHSAQVQAHPAKGQINAQLPPAKVENPIFTVPAKFQRKTVYQVHPRNNEKVLL
ncbi:hypothetical protein H6G96_02720 [Nostoc sp. FACHB-892]|uniref:hypothetical protein n=1 Tax=Nostoc sp. FACHB-892 TaxID=2692843 RepID=UPI0016893F71|nr:hypothetical protein [Nostoc sp. FACHB-892]MBD2725260.1 hypothetical protein [Nostoc sp. FACHB-892]